MILLEHLNTAESVCFTICFLAVMCLLGYIVWLIHKDRKD